MDRSEFSNFSEDFLPFWDKESVLGIYGTLKNTPTKQKTKDTENTTF